MASKVTFQVAAPWIWREDILKEWKSRNVGKHGATEKIGATKYSSPTALQLFVSPSKPCRRPSYHLLELTSTPTGLLWQ